MQSDWARIREVFEQLVALPPSERASELVQAVGGQPTLMHEVQRLLAADTDSVGLEKLPSAADWLEGGLDRVQAGQCIARWRLLRPLGQGGMGVVWLAERTDVDFTQRVALKRIRAPGFSTQAHARFITERNILARLSHPHIASLIDGGIDADGQPFLAIEYVEGVPLSEYVTGAGMDFRESLGLFLDVCTAVSHAHQNLVIHRDLKPSNILVAQGGKVKLLDFGIAKLLDQTDANAPELTATGLRLYTPGYAAPEQLRGHPVSTATDVFALGVLLYELVSRRRPFEVPSQSPIDWERALLCEEPKPPSRVDTTSTALPTHALIPRPWLRDLDAIVMKALRPEPTQRYPTVHAMVVDLQAMRDGRPVSARRGDRGDRVLKFLRRHALAIGMSGMALLALLIGLAVALWQAERAAMERDIARREALTAERSLRFMTHVFQLADPGEARGETVAARDLLDRGARSIGADLVGEPEARARLQISLGQAYAGLGLAPQALEQALNAWKAANQTDDVLLKGRALGSLSAAYSQNGQDHNAEARLREALALTFPEDALAKGLRADLELALATVLASGSRLDEAGRWFEAGLTRQRDTLGSIDPSVVIPYSSYLHAVGRVSDAETLLREALERVRRERTGDDPLRASLAAQMAINLVRQGRADEAIVLQQEALESKRKVYGDQHPSVDLTRHNLAKSLSDLGRWIEAEALLVDLLPRLRERNGLMHPRTAASEAALARVYLETNRLQEALPLWDSALATALAQWGDTDVAVGIVRLGRGQTLRALGRADSARIELDRAIATYTALGKHGLAGLARSLGERARARLDLGDVEGCLSDAGAGLALDPTAPLIIAYVEAVRADCLVALGHVETARDQLTSAKQHMGSHAPESSVEARYVQAIAARIRAATGASTQ